VADDRTPRAHSAKYRRYAFGLSWSRRKSMIGLT
jgi:hypothetical protein